MQKKVVLLLVLNVLLVLMEIMKARLNVKLAQLVTVVMAVSQRNVNLDFSHLLVHPLVWNVLLVTFNQLQEVNHVMNA